MTRAPIGQGVGAPADAGRATRASTEPASSLGHSAGIPSMAVERLALNLRAYAYAMGAPRTENDEEVAMDAARLILPKLETMR